MNLDYYYDKGKYWKYENDTSRLSGLLIHESGTRPDSVVFSVDSFNNYDLSIYAPSLTWYYDFDTLTYHETGKINMELDDYTPNESGHYGRNGFFTLTSNDGSEISREIRQGCRNVNLIIERGLPEGDSIILFFIAWIEE